MTASLKILMIEDDIVFSERAKRNIKKFEVKTVSTISDALQSIQNGEISLIVADIKLKNQERGDEILESLFHNGEAIPVILMTAFDLTDEDKRHFKSLGVIEILSKAGENVPLSKAIERTATHVLNNKNNRFVLFEKNVWQEGLQNKNMAYSGLTKKISEWLEIAKSVDDQNKRTAMLQELALVCDKYHRHKDNRDYVFPRF